MKEKKSGFINKIKECFLAAWNFIRNFITNHKILAILIILALIAGVVLSFIKNAKKNDDMPVVNEATVNKQNIQEIISASSVLEPNAEYTITPLVTGEILEAPFEEGDKVQKGQLMYQFDTSDMENDIESAQLQLKKSQNSYDDAQEAMDDLYIKSESAGTVSTVYVKVGDTVNNGTKIADIYDASTIKARIPFNSSDADRISIGDNAELTVVGTGSRLAGRVTEISSGTQAASGRMLVRYVTIETTNPGALMSGDTVTAMVGDIACNDVGTIENIQETSITAKAAGTVKNLYISAGDYVSSNKTLCVLESDSLSSQLENAELTLRDTQLSIEKLEQKLEDYSITAPISGTVVAKNKKAGEEYEGGAGSSSVGTTTTGIAVIYDMSSLCFTLDIDELEIKKVAVGQTVTVTADISDKKYSGVVENVSVSGTVGTNGVTTYPVKVRLTDFDDALLPGMNIEAEIVVESAENVLAIPVNALNRGDIVYVKGEKTDENDKAPEGYYSVPVKTGISNDSFIEITEGLSEGDTIYVPAVQADNTNEMQFPMGGMPGGGMPGGGMSGGGMPGGGNMNRGGGMPGGGMR